MRIVADLHLHSKYSRATSRDMDVENMTRWAKIKGITLLGTGDFTHPVWLRELRAKLKPTDRGLFTYDDQHFMLTVEVSNIYSTGGRLRKIHNVIFAPSFEVVDKINAVLGRFGNLMADGRPTLTVPTERMVEYLMEISSDCMLVPAHAWTPWFSLYGSMSGFDAMAECFGDQLKHIAAVETGLSSDPAMNWRLSDLDRVMLISNSDAHSPAKLGREANVFACNLDYFEILRVLREKDTSRFLYTLEFFPEEGKYHYDGHRACDKRMTPKETRQHGGRCPVCGKSPTVGVLHRVETLADREEGFVPEGAVPYRNLIPLEEIIAEARGARPGTVGVREEYFKLCKAFDGEFDVLLDAPIEEILKHTTPRVAEGLRRTREGRVSIAPGYDGVFGVISLFREGEVIREVDVTPPPPARSVPVAQTSLF
jgi:uncharacterized protein (TIGR00375 family)